MSEHAKVTSAGKTQVAQWQRLPSQLLHEFCQGKKRPPPKFKNIGSAGAYKYRVVVCDPKDSEKDLFFVPAHAVVNEEQAKEESALLALLQLTPTLPHERKLPDPYKTTWLNAIQSHKNLTSKKMAQKDASTHSKTSSDNAGGRSVNQTTPSDTQPGGNAVSGQGDGAAVASSSLVSGTKYASNSARRQQTAEKRRLQNARIRKHDAVRMANQNHPVFMSASIRRRIERLLRGESAAGLSSENDDDSSDDEQDPADGGESDGKVYVVHRLHSEGFSKRHSRSAYEELAKSTHGAALQVSDDELAWDQAYEECLQWLLVHLDEDQLPEGYDPRGNMLDVVAVPTTTTTRSSAPSTLSGSAVTAGSDAASIAFANRHGISVVEATLMAGLASKQGLSPLDMFWNAVRAAANVKPNNDALPCEVAAEDLIEMAHDELEALVAIFDSGCTVKSEGRGCSLVSVALEDGAMSLDVLVEDGIYPGVHPKRVTVSGTMWPSTVGAALHVALAKFINDLPLGEPVIFSIHAHAQDLLQSDDLSDLSLLMPHLSVDEATAPSDRVANVQRRQQGFVANGNASRHVQQRRPRERRNTFWTIHPRDTPCAVAFPKVALSMERTRKGLPAASSRGEFLAAMKLAQQQGSRVVLVTGETGSGKFRGGLLEGGGNVGDQISPYVSFVATFRQINPTSCLPLGRRSQRSKDSCGPTASLGRYRRSESRGRRARRKASGRRLRRLRR